MKNPFQRLFRRLRPETENNKLLFLQKESPDDLLVAIGGNPNVGKSTVFNALTGLRQHTGNWAGKTVSTACGECRRFGKRYILTDIPGTYSLFAHSAEEEVARDFLCFGGADAALIVCDATCLERNLNLVLQTMEITPHTAVCINLMDEAEKRKIRIDPLSLERRLGIPVTTCTARSGKGLDSILALLKETAERTPHPVLPRYTEPIEKAAALLEPLLPRDPVPSARWLSLRLLEPQESWTEQFHQYIQSLPNREAIQAATEKAVKTLEKNDIFPEDLQDQFTSCLVRTSEDICCEAILSGCSCISPRDKKIDSILTGRFTAIPFMLLLLAMTLWLTISGANVPSELLSQGLSSLEVQMVQWFQAMHAPPWLISLLFEGVWRVLSWVVAVMLPPMAIFFPLFTLLEDLGYLPRIAFNLDKPFCKAHACGKQALTMCMGFGCNAAGVTGCRIIDSPRERLIAILTNSFVPCNGRFPALITLITIFFTGASVFSGFLSALMLTGFILLGILMTFLVSRLLSCTLLKGLPSSFTLELPPYRRPQIGKVILRSVVDRTLFVLARAVAVAAPAGLIIWLLANIETGGASLLAQFTAFLDPLGRTLGMDGVILAAFILGFPANEIVIPIMIMAYSAAGSLTELNLAQLHTLFLSNGWSWVTALCTLLFFLMHWPCSTTLITIGKETHSLKWPLLAFFIPTICGMLICFLVASGARLLGVC